MSAAAATRSYPAPWANNAVLPPEIVDSVSLNCRYVYRPPFQVPDTETKTGNLTLTYAVQIHACVIELDEETGQVRLLKYGAVDDCGSRINPQIIEGQVHGATAHGIGAALHEAFDYSEDGQLLNASFYDYHAATSLDIPAIKTDFLESPPRSAPTAPRGWAKAEALLWPRSAARSRTRSGPARRW